MWLVGVVSRRQVWLECIGVISGCCCKEVYRFPHITYPYSTCISSFVAAASLLLCSFFKCFSFLVMLFLCNIANVAQRTFEIVQKSRSREHGDIIILTRTYVDCARASPETSTCELPRDVSRKLQLTLCAIMAS